MFVWFFFSLPFTVHHYTKLKFRNRTCLGKEIFFSTQKFELVFKEHQQKVSKYVYLYFFQTLIVSAVAIHEPYKKFNELLTQTKNQKEFKIN